MLLARPGRPVAALELIGGSAAVPAAGDAGAVLDDEAKRAYRARLPDLEEELEEAERFGDRERASRARDELEFLHAELAAAVGLAGRDRRLDSPAERARVSTTKVIKQAIKRIEAAHPQLGRHLRATVRTGTFCCYSGDLEPVLEWEVVA